MNSNGPKRQTDRPQMLTSDPDRWQAVKEGQKEIAALLRRHGARE